jgi:diguanylate cyclase (GGDEF)-like protein
MAAVGAVLSLVLVRPLSPFPTAATLPWPIFIALFAVTEWWCLHVPLRRATYLPSLSGLPLAVGLCVLAPWSLVLAWVIGTAVGLAVVRRDSPRVVVRALGLVAIEASVAVLVIHRLIPSGHLAGPLQWGVVVAIVAAVSLLDCAVNLVSLSLSVGRLTRERVWRSLGVALAAALATSCAALILVTLAGSDAVGMGLVLATLAGLTLGVAAYGGERHKRRRIQHLYASRDLLQSDSRSPLSVPTLLQRLCQIFEAGFAEVVILPDSPDQPAQVVHVRGGHATEMTRALDKDMLDDVFAVIVPPSSSVVLRPGVGPSQGGEILARRDLKDAIMTALQVEGRVLGVVLVGDRKSDLETFDDEDCKLLSGLGAQIGVSLENLRLDERLKHQAFHDALTGLANRTLFADRVAHALRRRVSPGHVRAAILFIDLDDFKVVNDSLGHACGDIALQSVTERLSHVIRPFDTVGRLGGDEFAVLLEDLAQPGEAIAVAERFLEELTGAFVVQGNAVTIHASVGVAIADNETTSPDDLLRQADVAMYRAKERGKATIETFEPSMQWALEHRVQMRNELEQALAADELYVEYQPVVSLRSGAVVGAEALARWTNPRRGWISPREFIPIAESAGLIRGIGEHVLRTACGEAVRWMRDQPDRSLSVSVNLSPVQLLHPGFASDVAAVLRDTGMKPSQLTLEITESLLVEDTATTLERLQALKDLGIIIAIDDFGTGYSSLGELKFLPVDALKIPKAFIDNVATDERERAFLAAIIGLGRTLGLRLVAVGVEDPDQRRQLTEMDCDMAQGFHFAPPLSADAMADLVQGGASSSKSPAPPAIAVA